MPKLLDKYFPFLIIITPIIHTVANVTTNYFPEASINPGLLRVIFLFFMVISYTLIISKFPLKKLFIISSVFILYNLILVLFNDDVFTPLINFVRVSLPIMFIFLAYVYINNANKLVMLFKSIIIGIFIYSVNYIIANYFGLGASHYLDGSFYIGGASAGASNEMAVYTLIGFSFLQFELNKKWRIFTVISITMSIIFLLLNLRRGSILVFIIGALVYLYYSGLNRNVIKFTMVISASLILLYPIYNDALFDRFDIRSDQLTSIENVEQEGRVQEFIYVPISLSNEGKWLTGTHNMNSSTYFGHRELHVGYMSILHGSGIIGIFLFFLFIGYLIIESRSAYKRSIHKMDIKMRKQLYSILLMLIASLLIYLLTSRLHSFNLTLPFYLVFGSIISCFHNYDNN